VFVVDTNVLVYAADEASAFRDPCRRLLERSRGQASAWYLTWGIIYEFLRVTTHARVFRRPWTLAQAWSFIEALLASPGLGILTPTLRHSAVVAEVFRELPHLSGNLLHDAQTAALMREHGIRRILTRDTDFHRFPFLEPVDPVAVL
jgi:toxin-antitoxin system PIN domain toxin